MMKRRSASIFHISCLVDKQVIGDFFQVDLVDSVPSGEGVLMGYGKFEEKKNVMEEGLVLSKSFVEPKVKTRGGICFLFGSMPGPVEKLVKSKLKFDGVGGDTRRAF